MKKTIFILAALLLGLLPNAQSQQDISLPGIVVRQNSRIKTDQVEYLPNVSVKATQAKPTRSDAQGLFTLVFSDKPAYNVTRVFAEKRGMEIVNKSDLERAAVLGRLDKLKIVMCPAGELMENQMLYYGIAEDAIVRRFKKRITDLEKANIDLEQLIAQVNEEFNLDLKTKNEAIYALEKEWSKALVAAQEAAEKFAAINLDDAGALYLQADSAFKKGDFEQVLQLLQYDLLDKNLHNIRSNLSSADSLNTEGRVRIARGTENLRQTIQNALFAARVAKLDGALKHAEAYYDLAVSGDEKNIAVVSEAAYFMQLQNKFAKARMYYAEVLPIYRQLAENNPDVYSPFVATALNNLGVLLKDNNDLEGAMQSYEEALQIRRKLAKKFPDVYLSHVAMTLNNMGSFYYANGDMETARQIYEEALQIFKQLVKDKSDVYLPNIATILNNLGALYYAQENMLGAKKAYEESLLIRRKLSEKKPDIYLPYVAGSLNNLGLWLMENKDIGGARQAYEESLEIRRKLTEKRPSVYLPDVAESLNNLGNLFSAENEKIKAKKSFDEALLIYRKLAEKSPDAYLPEVAKTLNNLGVLLKDNNDLEGAKQSYEEAIQIYRDLDKKSLDVYLPNIARTLNNFGLLLKGNNDIEGAKRSFEEAIQIYRDLDKISPNVYLPSLAKTWNNLGNLLSDENDMISAILAYEEDLQIRRNLVEKNSEAYLPKVAETLNSLGMVLKENNDIIRAKLAIEEALQINRNLAENNPRQYNLKVVVTDVNLGLIYKQQLIISGDMSLKESGLDLMYDARQHLSVFPESHPMVQQILPFLTDLRKFFENFDATTFQFNQLLKQIIMLDVQKQVEKDSHEKALLQEEIVRIQIEIENLMPDNEKAKNITASGYVLLAWYQLLDKHFTAAEQSASNGLKKAPEDERGNSHLALALLYQGKWEEAKQVYSGHKNKTYGEGTFKDVFLEDLDALEKEGITHPDVAKARSFLQQK